MKTNFYLYTQNHSGGIVDRDEWVQDYVIVEAKSEKKATKRMFDIISNSTNSESCECCGSRWWYWDIEVIENTKKDQDLLAKANSLLAQNKFDKEQAVIIHFLNKKIKVEL